jgi:hypothetical protein
MIMAAVLVTSCMSMGWGLIWPYLSSRGLRDILTLPILLLKLKMSALLTTSCKSDLNGMGWGLIWPYLTWMGEGLSDPIYSLVEVSNGFIASHILQVQLERDGLRANLNFPLWVGADLIVCILLVKLVIVLLGWRITSIRRGLVWPCLFSCWSK